jgi:hypothetical protein
VFVGHVDSVNSRYSYAGGRILDYNIRGFLIHSISYESYGLTHRECPSNS